jgi:hypothetical protein
VRFVWRSGWHVLSVCKEVRCRWVFKLAQLPRPTAYPDVWDTAGNVERTTVYCACKFPIQVRFLPWWKLPARLVSLHLSHFDLSGAEEHQQQQDLEQQQQQGAVPVRAAAARGSEGGGGGDEHLSPRADLQAVMISSHMSTAAPEGVR